MCLAQISRSNDRPLRPAPLSSTRYLRLSTFTRDMIARQTRSGDNVASVDSEKSNTGAPARPLVRGRVPHPGSSIFSFRRLFSGYAADAIRARRRKLPAAEKKEL